MPKWTIREYQRGLLYRKGQFAGVLSPGRYWYWPWAGRHIDVVDMRETSQTVEGQEILTSDKIGVRVSLVAQYRVTDAVAARHEVENYVAHLYQDLQLTLRETITSRTLEELMKDRDALSSGLQAAVALRSKKYGVELLRIGVKDIVLPGPVLAAVFLQEVEAELKGRASLVAARHEQAAARARANTVRMFQENPHLARLQELEVLTNLAAKPGNIIVIPGLERFVSRHAPGPETPSADKT